MQKNAPAEGEPLFFHPNRVWRCYAGGALIDRMRGVVPGEDTHFPEDWIASATVADNRAHQQHPREGLSRVRLGGADDPYFADLLAQDPARWLGPSARGGELGILCKFLDSAIRLPIQCHPDRAFAKEHYHSHVGKTECWAVLGTRPIDGEEPYLLIGFKPGATREQLADAVARQDMRAATAMLHRMPARPGDVWFIPGRLPHAIGPGCLILEVQEPSDWVVQPERRIGDVELSDHDMWGPLTPEVGLDCFDYDGAADIDTIRARFARLPRELRQAPGGSQCALIGPETTDCFRMELWQVTGSLTVPLRGEWRIGVPVAGAGTLMVNAGGATRAIPVRAGEPFFLPYGDGDVTLSTDGALTVYSLWRDMP